MCLANDLGLDVTRWTLSGATGILAVALTIVGWGAKPNSQTEAWLANLRIIPESAILWMLLPRLVLMTGSRVMSQRTGGTLWRADVLQS